MNKISRIAAAMMLVLSLILTASPVLVLADTKSVIQGGVNEANGGTPTNPKSIDDTITTAVNLLSAAAGIVAVIMVIIGGLRYITSAGDSNKITSAKNTLLYAVIGLVIVALAQVIVHFVLHKVS